MPKVTKENSIEEKLEYLGLNLEKIPKFLKEYKNLEYRPLKVSEENMYKVYRYIPISKIQILLSPTNRLNTIKEKYGKAKPLANYLDPKEEEDIVQHTTFLRMLKQFEIEDIKLLEEEQKRLNKEIPFKVKYEENYLWQIYYSDTSDTYFMVVPTEDLEYTTFFYLLKKQIEYRKTKKEEMIFVPICYEDYEGKYLKSSEISDIDKYLWFFTKNWSNIYEVYDKKENLNIVIVGSTIVYDNIVSLYKNKLKTKEEAIKFYKLIKALFILGTELPHHFKFLVKINRYGALEFEYKKKKITYDNLLEILNKEYEVAQEEMIHQAEKEAKLELELNNLKEEATKKDEEYFIKEKQIATYLECKKTFFGRVKYFFTTKKKKKQVVEEDTNQKEKEEKIEVKPIEFVKKEYYTIEDVIKIYKQFDQIASNVKNLEQDIVALKNKIKSVETKIKNANLYIEEIDTHEKNIFEFWKFTNKDESKLLHQGIEEEIETVKKIDKVYHYKEDLEEISSIVDKKMRKSFTKPDFDAFYILTTDILDVIKELKNKEKLEESLEKLKKEVKQARTLFSTEKLDIFGGMEEDQTKIKILGNKKHREVAKDKFKILDIQKDTSLEEYKNTLLKVIENVHICMEKAASPIAIPIYIVAKEDKNIDGLQTFYISPEEALQEFFGEKEVNLYKINLKEGSPVIYFSNIVYYDNYNKTLPLGMNITTKGLIDMKQYYLKQVEKDNFRINELTNENKVNIKKISTFEYEILEESNDK